MPQYFPDSFIQEVMDRNEIIDIISRYMKLKRSGNSYKGLCPFHKEKTPSFTVSADKQMYHCFGCSKGGTVITFIMQMENLDFVEAVKYLADKAGLSIPESNTANTQSAENRQLIYKINTDSGRFFYDQLLQPQGTFAREYVNKRGLIQNTVNKFGLGYSPNGNYLLTYLREKGYTDDELVMSGMIGKSENGSLYDRFRNRLMFPIIDMRKNIIGFGGRKLDAADDKSPKYLNSPETAAFNKSYNLYGLNFAKNSKSDYFILVEGYMDVIALHQSGFSCAIATLGTALTPEQARIIKRMRQQVIIAYDSDSAGQAATKRATEILAKEDLTVKIITMNNSKDPDEYIKANGRGAFQKLIDEAQLQIEYKISKLKEMYNLDIIEDKIKYINTLAQEFSLISSPVEREIYVKKIAEETNVSADSIFREIDRILAIRQKTKNFEDFRANTSQSTIKNTDPKRANLMRAQNLLLNLMCFHDNVYQKVKESLDANDFEDGINRQIFDIITSVRESGKKPDARLIVNNMPDTSSASEILHDDQNIDSSIEAAMQAISLILKEKEKQKLFEKLIQNKNDSIND